MTPVCEALKTAAPGEPCAWRWHWLTGSDRDREWSTWTYSETPPADLANKIVEPLYTTPQPAAGWNEAAGYAESLAVVLWKKHFKNDAPQWKPLSGDLIGLLTQINNMTTSLRREAPAPAEGVKERVLSELRGRRLLNDVDDDLHQEIAESLIKAVRG